MPKDPKGDATLRLRSEVEPAGLREFETDELDSWLSSKVTEYNAEVNLLAKFKLEGHREAVRTCQRLLTAASALAETLDGLVLRPSLDGKLFDACVALGTPPNTQPDLRKHSQRWEACKGRMVNDLEDLQRVAHQALADLNRGGRNGRPPQSWRDATFYSLFKRLHAAGPMRPKEATVDLARRVWEIYSPDASTAIMGEEAAEKIVNLRGRGRART